MDGPVVHRNLQDFAEECAAPLPDARFFVALARLARPFRLTLVDLASGEPLAGAPLPAALAPEVRSTLARWATDAPPRGPAKVCGGAFGEPIEIAGCACGLLLLTGRGLFRGGEAAARFRPLADLLRAHLTDRLEGHARARELSETKARLDFLLETFRLSHVTGTDLEPVLREVLGSLTRLRGIGGGFIHIESVDFSGRRRVHRIEQCDGPASEGVLDALRDAAFGLRGAVVLDDPFTLRHLAGGRPVPYPAAILAPVSCGHDRTDFVCPMRALRTPARPCEKGPCWRGALFLHGRPGAVFTRTDRDFVKHVVERLVLQFFSAFLLLEHERSEKLNREMTLARQIQTNLLPKRAPQVAGIELRTYNQCAELIGGDFYDYHDPRKDLLLVAVGDISGKSVSAALLHSLIQRALHDGMTQQWGIDKPRAGAILKLVNGELYESLCQIDMFATLFLLRVDVTRRFLEFANAGHVIPFLCRAGRAIPFNEAPGVRRIVDPDQTAPPGAAAEGGTMSGTPIGFLPSADYGTFGFPLERGDAVLLFTDGLVEVFRDGGEGKPREIFGEARLAEAFARAGSLPADQALSSVMREIGEFSRDAELRDDQTALLLRFHDVIEYAI